STVAAKAALAEEPREGKPAPDESRSRDKPRPISTGPSQAEGIAKFTGRAKYADLTGERRQRLNVGVLHSLACAISALGPPPVAPLVRRRSRRASPRLRSSAARAVGAP